MFSAGRGNTKLLVCNQIRSLLTVTLDQHIGVRIPGGQPNQINHLSPERWFTHCSDGAEFLGAMGKQELLRAGADAVQVIRNESGYASDEWERYFGTLNAEHGPATAYLFKCRHCGTIGGYSGCR